MTSDNLLKFLGNREYLHQVSYQELKSLVVQYPYSLSLRYLLGMKSRQEDNQDLERNKELLATYGIDRSHLFDLFNEIPEVLEDLDSSILMQEDFLELKELSALERELDEKILVPTTNDLTFISEPLAAPIPNNGFISKKESPTEEVIEIREPLDNSSQEIDDISSENPSILSDPIIIEDQPEELITEEFFEADYPETENIKDIPQEGVSAIISGKSTSDHFDKIVEDSGLPVDAVEVDDFKPITDEIQQKAIEDLFEETENEVIAEGAVSDSIPYLENPEEILIQESKLVDTVQQEEQVKANPISQSDIPFEVIHSETDPIVITENTNLIEVSDLADEMPISKIHTDTSSDEFIDTNQEIKKEAIAVNDSLEALIENDSFIPEVEANSPSSEIMETIADREEGSEVMEEPTAISESFLPEVEGNTASSEIIETIANKDSSSEATNEVNPLIIESLAQVQEELHIEELHTSNTPQITVEELSLIESTLHLKKDKKQPKIIARTKTPAPKIAFNSWASQGDTTKAFSGINILKIPIQSDSSLNTNRRKKKRSKKRIKARFKKTVALAEESLKMSEGIASETLAQLLVLQGHYKKATAMFKQLCLIMPEKSAFFAGEIERIQNLKEEDS